MRGLVWHGGDVLTVEQLAAPDPRAGEVTLNVELAGICGSDLHAYRGHPGGRHPPLVLGHEAVGRVAGRPGRFTLFPIVSCGRCRACLEANENLCERRGLVGLDRPGVFAEAVPVREDALVAVPDAMPDRAAALVEPLATGLSALRKAAIRRGSVVLVVGGGPIGLLAVHAADAIGAHVLAVEPVASRRELAERLGAAETFRDVAEVPAGRADFAIDAVGLEATWRGAIACVRSGGSVAIVGLGQADGAMPVGDLVRRGVSVHGHYAYSREDFRAALELLAAHRIDLSWITVMPLDEGAEGFRRLTFELDRVVKVMLDPVPANARAVPDASHPTPSHQR
jgi:threonine dehydrogenase-like Zn-dependent dehydrogenase